MGLIGAIAKFAPLVITAVSNVVTYCAEKFGGSTGKAMVEAGKKLGPAIGVNPKIVTTIGVIALGVGTILGITNENDRLDVLAEKAMLPDTKNPDEFDNHLDYLDYLKNDVEFDENTLANKTDEELAANSFIGSMLLSKGIEEKSNMTIPTEFWITAGENEMESEEVLSYMDSFKENGIDDMGVMTDYLSGSCEPSLVDLAGDAIQTSIENFNPELTADEVEAKFEDMMIKDTDVKAD